MKTQKFRLPSRQDILPVFAVFLFFGFSWALYRMFWYVPSWLKYLSIWKVLAIGAYVMAFGLVESLFMTCGLALFSLFFPSRIFRDKYALLGSSLAGIIGVLAVLLQRKIGLVYRLELWQVIGYFGAFLAGLIIAVLTLSWIYRRIPLLGRFVQDIADRMVIFVYFYAPLGLLGLIVVLFRVVFKFVTRGG